MSCCVYLLPPLKQVLVTNTPRFMLQTGKKNQCWRGLLTLFGSCCCLTHLDKVCSCQTTKCLLKFARGSKHFGVKLSFVAPASVTAPEDKPGIPSAPAPAFQMLRLQACTITPSLGTDLKALRLGLVVHSKLQHPSRLNGGAVWCGYNHSRSDSRITERAFSVKALKLSFQHGW